jgi:diguanylate cyclase (GGDEF)-like protein
VGRALPDSQCVAAEHALAAVWQVGHEPFDGVLISFSAGDNAGRAVRSLRRVAPRTRIVVACEPADEPTAQQVLQQGADDYVIEPIARGDLERAFQMPSVSRPPISIPAAEPSLEEKTQFVGVLQNLTEGPQAALDRLVNLIRQAFESSYAAIQIDEFAASVGQPAEAVLQEPIRRQDATVGAVTLGRPLRGSYSAVAAARLGDYARLADAVVTVARDRAHWQNLAWSDDLSQLRNRRYFERRLDELLAACARQRTELTVLLLDIDDFKHYNDRFGHETGDALIREVAFLLVHCSRESDVVARYGGDEFVVILWEAEKARVPGSKHPRDLLAFVERYREAIREHGFHCLGPDAPGEVTVSGGLASFPWDGKTREQLLSAADEALLTAKRTGKDRILLAGGSAAEGADATAERDK